MTNLIPKTVITIRESRANPDDPMALLELIGACERFVQVSEKKDDIVNFDYS